MDSTVGLTLNFRNAACTIACVNSLLSEGVNHVLVWDNSEDDSRSGTEVKKYFSQNSSVTVFICPLNLGFSNGVNNGLRWIKNKFGSALVLLINNDATLVSGALSTLADALNRNPAAVFSYPSVCQNGKVFGTLYYHRYLALVTTKRLPGAFPYASGCALLIALSKIAHPFLDDDFFMYGEDCALGWKYRGKFTHAHKALILHEGSKSSKIGSLFYESRLVSSHLILAHKLSENKAEKLISFFFRFTVLPVRALTRAIRHRNLAPITAFFTGVKFYFNQDAVLERAKHYSGK